MDMYHHNVVRRERAHTSYIAFRGPVDVGGDPGTDTVFLHFDIANWSTSELVTILTSVGQK